MTAPKASLLALTLALFPVVACSDGDGRASAILCSTAYRASVTEPLTQSEHLRIEDEDSVDSMAYVQLELHARYSTGRTDNERALRLWVTPSGEDGEIVSQLFQLPPDSGPTNQFVGGHGFTGLNYAYDSASGAELQYWCEAE